MRLTRLTYSAVEAGVAAASAESRNHDDGGVAEFLHQHVARLLEFAGRGDTGDAHFFDDEPRDLFAAVADGDETAFLAAATELTARLVGQMDRRTRPGLLVCATFDDAGERLAAVLKLQVAQGQGAVLQRLHSGQDNLAGVQNVLDRPGELQKGALYPDPRAGSDAVLGEKLNQSSLYFPTALGLRQDRRRADGAGALVNAVAEVAGDQVAADVAEALPTVGSGTVAEVLGGLAEALPDLTEDVRADVVRALATEKRPVTRVDPAKPVRGEVLAGDVRIVGPVSVARDAVWTSLPGGTWQVTIIVDAPPQRRFT